MEHSAVFLKNRCRLEFCLCGAVGGGLGKKTDATLFFLLVSQSNAQGTVPYLGIFLTDLTMLDTAVKDRLDVSALLSAGLGFNLFR